MAVIDELTISFCPQTHTDTSLQVLHVKSLLSISTDTMAILLGLTARILTLGLMETFQHTTATCMRSKAQALHTQSSSSREEASIHGEALALLNVLSFWDPSLSECSTRTTTASV